MKSYTQPYWERKSDEGRLMARESNRVQDEKRRTRQIPDDTLLMRAKSDAKMRAKGTVLRHGITYTATGERRWQIRRAVRGRINQVEFVVNGAVRGCGSMRKAESAIRSGLWSGKTPQP